METLIVVVAIGVASYLNAIRLIRANHSVVETQEILDRLDVIHAQVDDAEISVQGYVLAGDPRLLGTYYASLEALNQEIWTLHDETAGEPAAQEIVSSLHKTLLKQKHLLDKIIQARMRAGFSAASPQMARERTITEEAAARISSLTKLETGFLAERSIRAKASDQRTILIIILGSALASLFLVLAALIVGGNIKKRKKAETELQYSALHDNLTGLANRMLFMERLNRCFSASQRGGDHGFAVLFIDLNHFKPINDQFGHAAGDELLVAVARLLRNCSRATDTTARLGGDEFAILVEQIHDLKEAVQIAERIQEEMTRPVIVGTHEICPSASIGIAAGGGGYSTPSMLLNAADTAMYRAKSSGKVAYLISDPAAGSQELISPEGNPKPDSGGEHA